MNKICTSIEQSKKLIKLGIDVNTSDMRYGYIAPYDFSDRMYDGGYDEVPYPKDFLVKNPNFSANEYDGELHAWSLSALVDLMPKNVEIERTYIGWRCDYYSNDDSLLKYGKDKNTLFDAVFEMVCWLKENGKI